MTFWDLFATAAQRHGTRVAVEIERAASLERWTYRELHATASDAARRLFESGVRAGDRCAILADNDPRWCAAYLAILRLGAIAVPIDTTCSAVQMAAILADAQPRLVLVDGRLERVCREALGACTVSRACDGWTGAEVTLLPERYPGSASATEHTPLFGSVEPSSTAVILYTPGTTADPKGVVLSHANLLAARDAAVSILDVREGDRVLGVLPLCGALGQLANLLLPLSAGARVVFLETLTSAALVRALAERRITISASLPDFLELVHQRILSELYPSGLAERVLFRCMLAASFRLRRTGINLGALLFPRVHALLGRHMRLFVTGGTKFDPAVGRDMYALGFAVVPAYGLTETSGAVTLSQPDEAHVGSVGRVLPGQELHLLPSEDSGLDGEIAIRGPIVMQGYHRRPELTAAVMRDGWLLTGDLGRLDDHGRLQITGRKQEVIVLVTGENIYPEEIEAQYLQSAYVKDICVLGLTREDQPASERLFAVVVPNMELMRARRIANAGDLLRFELEGQSVHLPPHKRVREYEVSFERLPRTATGRLKRREVERRVRQTRCQVQAAHEISAHDWRDDTHAAAAAALIAGRVKGAALVPDANLELHLGLDSIERVQLIAELEQRFGVRVAPDRAHDVLTVQQLIDAVRPRQAVDTSRPAAECWAVLLRDLPDDDPVLSRLLVGRRAMPLLFYGVLRALRLVMPRVVVSGHEHLPAHGPYIISPNHQSYLDPFFVCGVLPYRLFKQLFFVGATEYFETPLTARLAGQFNLVPVDPDAKLVPAMQAGAFGLTNGKILLLFPEGERSIDGTVKRFKKGAAILARHVGVAIVPVAIHGLFELWPRNRAFNWRLLLPGSGHRIHIAFGAPLIIDEDTPYSDAATTLRQRVTGMWDQLARVPVRRRGKHVRA